MLTDAYTVTDCGSHLGKLVGVTISTCKSTAPACTLYRGKNSTLNIDFIPEKSSSSVKAIAHGKYSGLDIPWPLDQPDACKNSGLVCPLQPGKTYRYSLTFPISRSYPPVHVEVKWELRDVKLSDDIICITFPVKI
ncbi:hypothetical protein L9F63_004243, partial [Diploptera punctata]